MTTMRDLLLRGVLCVLAASALLLAARPAPELEAAVGGCTVSCANGPTCGASPEIGQQCTCTCDLYGGGSAKCTCAQLRPNTPG
jgi:hypothetical protein